MTFEEFQARIAAVPETKGMAYTAAALWLHPFCLPAGLLSVRNVKAEIVRIPEKIVNSEGYAVPVIGAAAGALAQNENMTDLILPRTWGAQLYNTVLKGCGKLKRMTFPKSIRRVSERAFCDCVDLEDIYYEGSEEEWGEIQLVRPKHRPVDECVIGFFAKVWNKPILGDPAFLHATVHFNCKCNPPPEVPDDVRKNQFLHCDGKNVKA